MDEMKRLLLIIGHDPPKEMSQDHGDGGEDGGDDKPKSSNDNAKGGDKPFDPTVITKKHY